MDERTMACGFWPLIEHGLRRYVEEHGCKPAMLVVHPTHLEYLCAQEDNDEALLDGLSITCSFERELPVLLDESGNAYEL